MARSASLTYSTSVSRLVLGFAAAFLATLTFHQIGLEILHLIGVTPGTPYNTAPVPPFGVPQVISLAFWGGIWGIVFVLVEPWLARSPGGYWVAAIIFGAIFPTGASWFIVAPLKSLPLGYGFHFPGLLVGPIVNGLWGLGTALFLGVLTGWRGRPGT
ncbi:MAG TPA: hypothetical protein VGP42_19065 [Stellaceae bacterium]|jgi:hypothetical protein|nr:hypothetical protein [Stellaceae bacterium]